MNQSLFAQYYNSYMMDGQNGGWGFMMMFILITIAAGFVLFFVKSATSSTPPRDSADPLDIVKARYAKGDITKVQFNEIKNDLKNTK